MICGLPRPGAGAPPRLARGFTLVEMLVVLVIVGLVATLLLEGFFQVEALRSRITDRVASAEARIAAGAWFRESVRAVHAYPVGSHPAFVGDPGSFVAISHAPLAGRLGSATVIRWTLVEDPLGDRVLSYRQGAAAVSPSPSPGPAASPAIAPWSVLSVARADDPEPAFAYRGLDGTLLPSWPPEGAPAGVVPAGVVLIWSRQGRTGIWSVAIDGRRVPRLDFSGL